jgi:hypothetical protein
MGGIHRLMEGIIEFAVKVGSIAMISILILRIIGSGI